MDILILANSSVGIYKFRKELIEELEKKHDVYVDIPDDEYRREIRDLGCKVNKNPYLERRGTNPFQDIRLLNYYRSMIRHLNPDVVLTFTIKPNVYGGMACSRYDVPYIANITGLGTSIQNGGILQKLTMSLYRYGLRKAQKVFFQNDENKDFMLSNKEITGSYEVLPGSGVNIDEFSYSTYPKAEDKTVFTTIGRIMKDKGIDELLSAAEIINNRYIDIEFRLVGGYDEDYGNKIEEYQNRGIIRYLGLKKDVRKYIEDSNAIIHPSYHEGMSNVLLEAAATGRPVIASNIHGCKETFDDGISGISFEPKNVDSLVEAIEKFLEINREKRIEMGKKGRIKMERVFSRALVVNKYLEEINKVGTSK